MINETILECCCSKGFEESEVYKAYKLFFGTLVSESRLKIINLLRNERKNVSEIVEELRLDQTAVSHDLARLKKCGFVQMEIEGKYRYYCLNKKTINPLMKLIDEHMSENCIHILNKTYNKKEETK